MYFPKVPKQKISNFFGWRLEGHWQKEHDPDLDPFVRGTDTLIRIRTKMSRFRKTGSQIASVSWSIKIPFQVSHVTLLYLWIAWIANSLKLKKLRFLVNFFISSIRHGGPIRLESFLSCFSRNLAASSTAFSFWLSRVTMLYYVEHKRISSDINMLPVGHRTSIYKQLGAECLVKIR